MRSLISILVMGLLAFYVSAGENLFYNSSFELEDHGWTNGICNTLEEYIGKIPLKRIADTTTAVHGKTSLKISCGPGYSTSWPMTSPDVTLEEGKKYTVSFYAKATTPATIGMLMYTNHNSRWNAGSKREMFVVGTEWKRYNFSFVFNPPEECREVGYDWFLLVDFPKTVNAFNFDALQLEEGDLTAYKPAAPVEYKIAIPEVYLQDKTQMTIGVSAISYEKDRKMKGNLILSETEKKRELSKTPFELHLPKNQLKSTGVPITKIPYGCFRLQVAETPRVSSETFVKIHENKALYEPGKFAVGIGTIMMGLPEAEVGKNPKRVKTDLYQIDEGEIVRRSGAVFVKSFDSEISTLIGMAPKKRGEYNWKMWDQFIAKCQKYQLKPLATIAAQSLYIRNQKKNQSYDGLHNGSTGNVPGWLAKLDRYGKAEDGSSLGDWGSVYCVFPPPEVIGEVAEAMAKRYGQTVFMLRLFPEANGYMTPEMLAEYAKEVYIRAKKAAPNLIVNTCTPTEDKGVEMSGFFYRFLKAGGGRYCDLYGFHPYSSTQDDSPLSAMDSITTFKENMQTFNAVKPLGDLECFYLDSQRKSDYRENGRYGSAHVARRLLIDMGEGLLLSAPLEVSYLHGTVAAVENNTRFFRRAPDARFAAHNAMGHFLNGSVNPRRIKIPGEILCYTFSNHGKTYSTIWNIAGKSAMKLTLPAGVSCEAFDHFGNSLGKFKQTLTMRLDREPKIICWSKDADTEKIHSTGLYERDTKAVFFGLKRLPGGLSVIMKNTSSAPLSGMLRLESEYFQCSKMRFENMKPFEDSSIFVPCAVTPGAPEQFDVTLIAMLDSKVYANKFPVVNSPIEKVTASSRTYQLGEHSFTLRKEGNNLVISADLKSKKMRLPQSPKSPWTGDSVEYFFDMAPASFSNPMNAYHENCTQIVVSATKNGVVEPMCLPSGFNKFGAKTKVKLVPGGARVTLRIPHMKYMGFTITINGGESSETWRGKKNYCNREAFAILEIE